MLHIEQLTICLEVVCLVNLNDNKKYLKEIIRTISEEMNINPVFIEKDYYVSMLLKEIFNRDPNFVFKGGTSLSKCYKIIDRFSEDIDLNYDYNGTIPSISKRSSINKVIEESIESLNLIKKYPVPVWTKRNFLRYKVEYNKNYNDVSYIKPDVQIETAFFLDSNPTKKKKMQSMIGEYLIDIGREDIVKEYGLEEFEVTVQSLERTFVDKCLAICDYVVSKRIKEHSRHLYDLHKIYPNISFDDEMNLLFKTIIKKRNDNKIGYQYDVQMKI